jgi:probable O-glycosylation ligase (exosortase A-associated)
MAKAQILVYLLTGVGCVGGIFRPYYGLLVYIAFAILRPGPPSGMWRWSVPMASYSWYVGVCMLIGWALHGFGRWRLGRGTAIVLVLLGYWLWCAVSTAQSIAPDRGWEFVVFLAKVFLPVLVGVTMIDTVREVKVLAWVIVLCQAYVALELNQEYYGGYNRVWEEGFGFMDNNCVAIAMVTCIGLAFFLGLSQGPWWGRLVALAAAALMTNVIMFSFSRGGVLALGITGVIAFFLLPKKLPHYLLFAVAVAVGLRLMGPMVWQRFLTAFGTEAGTTEASAASRLALWQNCTELAIRNPIFGVGPDQFGLYAPEFGWKLGKEAHSLWFQNLAEVGLPGFCLLAAFFLLPMIRLWPLTRERTPVSDPWIRDGARMVIASLAGFVVAAQFVTIKYLEVPFYVALLGVCLLKLNQAPATGLSGIRFLPAPADRGVAQPTPP